jgi:hypothetical protein
MQKINNTCRKTTLAEKELKERTKKKNENNTFLLMPHFH